ncbi:Hsp20/alpha crystallin family protein [Glycomyces sp. NPDC049804]|uniref:Hsp20/alpha crystallin family protein n=1 Tax=Glycomyces sp. NPDC049804 TaxID=3154363 RepID=UPI00343037B7
MDDFTAYMNQVMGPYFAPLESAEGAWAPSADVSENDEAYHVDIDLPGVEKEDITVGLEGQELTVTGESKKLEHMEGSTRRAARSVGKFEFAVRLPHAVDSAACTAEFSNGVLCMTLPKTATGDHKTIEVK